MYPIQPFGLPLFLLFCLCSCGNEPKLSSHSPTALSFYEKGVRLWDQFYYAEAKACLDSALMYDSTFAMAWGRLAVLNFDTRDEARARNNIATALRFSRNATPLEQLYIKLWHHRIHFADRDAGRVADSLIQAFPDDAEAHVMRAALYESVQQLDSAITLYRRAVELDTGYAKAVMLLGYAYSTVGDQEKAIAQMQQYIKLAPHLADPRASYADLLMRVGRYDEALDQYRKSLELKPDYWYAINQIGSIYSALGRLRDAESQFERGLSFLPQGPQIDALRIVVRADLNMRRGQHQKALEEYSQVLAIDSTNYDASYGLVSALSKLGRFDEAHQGIADVRAELERRNLMNSQLVVGFHLMRARVLMDEGRLDEAKSACNDAFEHSTPVSRGAVFRQLAEIYLKTGEYDNAFDACEEALGINPNSPPSLLTLTKLYDAKKDRRMTREIGNRLLSLWKDIDPDFQDALELKKVLGMNRAR